MQGQETWKEEERMNTALYLFSRAAVAMYHELSGLSHITYSLPFLEARNPRSHDGRAGSFRGCKGKSIPGISFSFWDFAGRHWFCWVCECLALISFLHLDAACSLVHVYASRCPFFIKTLVMLD